MASYFFPIDHGYETASVAFDKIKTFKQPDKNSAPGETKAKSLEEASALHTNEADKRLERIINKFKSGQKLSQSEMSYLAEKAPEIYQEVVRILNERRHLELQLAQAKSSIEAVQALSQAMNKLKDSAAAEDSGNGGLGPAEANHYSAAFREHMKTAKYEEDDENTEENAEEKEEEDSTQIPTKIDYYV